jgi:hypothetical protein
VAGGSAAKAAREPRKTWNFIPCFPRRSLVAFAVPPVNRQKILLFLQIKVDINFPIGGRRTAVFFLQIADYG